MNPTNLIHFRRAGAGGQTLGRGPTAVSATEFAVAVFVAWASWQLLLAGSGAVLGRVITTSRGQLMVALVSAAIMIALAGKVIMS